MGLKSKTALCTRRSVLLLIGGSAGVVVSARFVQEIFGASYLTDERAAGIVRFSRRYKRFLPEKAASTGAGSNRLLVRKIWYGIENPGIEVPIESQLESHIRNEFEHGWIAYMDDWPFTHTEMILLELAKHS